MKMVYLFGPCGWMHPVAPTYVATLSTATLALAPGYSSHPLWVPLIMPMPL